MKFGTTTHTAILEPHEFDARHTHFPLPVNRKLTSIKNVKGLAPLLEKEAAGELTEANARKLDEEREKREGVLCKDEAEAFEEREKAAGRTVLDVEDHERALYYGELVRSDPACQMLLSDGQPEVSIFYADEETGVLAKTRQDWGLTSHGLVVDVKTTASLSERFLTQHIADLGYDVQAVTIRDSCRAHGIPWTGHVIIWCRTDKNLRPRVEVQRLTPLWFQRGEVLARQAFHLLAECQASGEWPGEPCQIRDTHEPRWLERWIEDRTATIESDEDFPEL